MIIIKLKRFPDNDELTHTGTTYQISSDINFENIIEEVKNSDINKTLYYSKVIIPEGHTYYSRAKRHFNNDIENVSSWTNPKPVTNISNEDTIVTLVDILVDPPIVNIDKTSLIDKDVDTIKITTTEFRGQGDGHYSTNWLVLDYFNNVLFPSLVDKENRTSLEIPKSDINFINKNRLKFLVSHNTATGIESDFGEVIMDIYGYNFEIKSNLGRVLPNKDFYVKIEKVNPELETGIRKVVLKELLSNNELWTTNYDESKNGFLIPGEMLKDDSKYYLDLIISTSTVDATMKRSIISTTSILGGISLDYSFTYKKEFKKVNGITDILVSTGLVVSEYDQNVLPWINNYSNKIMKHRYDKDFNVETTMDNFTGISLLNNNNDGTYFNYQHNHKIFIDTLDDNDDPTFMLYQHDIISGTAVLLNTTVRENETESLGFTNNIIHLEENVYIYVPHNKKTLMKLDTTSMTITSLGDIPLDTTAINIFNLGRNRIAIMGGDNKVSLIYNTKLKTYQEGINIPTEFRDRKLKIIKLINGDVLIVKLTYIEEKDELNNVLYYSSHSGELEIINTGLDKNIIMDNSVNLRNGNILLSSTELLEDQYILFN